MKNEKNWNEIIKNQPTSGMNVREYCKTLSLATSTFYKQKRSFADPASNEEAFSEVSIENTGKSTSMFIDGHLFGFDASLMDMVIGALR